MTVVTDPKTRRVALVERCRSCAAPIYWSTTDAGKRCPFDVVADEPTRVSHFATCPDAKQWGRKSRARTQ
jgi:hypothetical protein